MHEALDATKIALVAAPMPDLQSVVVDLRRHRVELRAVVEFEPDGVVARVSVAVDQRMVTRVTAEVACVSRATRGFQPEDRGRVPRSEIGRASCREGV